MTRRPFLPVLLSLGCLALTGCLGWFAMGHVRSPSQVVADVAPPPKTRLTVPVRRSPLHRTVVARGTIALGAHRKVTLPAHGVLTGVDVGPGQVVRAGDRVASVNDRPVLLLRGEIPLWRDLEQGDSGEDVRRLQAALNEAGYSHDDPDGRYGPSTAAAVERLYAANGAVAGQRGRGDRQYVARAELLMVADLPATVVSVAASLGGEEQARSFTLTRAAPVVRARLIAADARRISPGDRVRVTPDDAVAEFRGRVVSVGAPRMYDEGGYLAQITIRPTRALDLRADGEPVQVAVRASRSKAELLVPITGIWQRPDGGAHVQVVLPSGEVGEVQVAVIEESNGLAAVRLRAGDRLRVGDDVVVGSS